jgi:hypothetical protein
VRPLRPRNVDREGEDEHQDQQGANGDQRDAPLDGTARGPYRPKLYRPSRTRRAASATAARDRQRWPRLPIIERFWTAVLSSAPVIFRQPEMSVLRGSVVALRGPRFFFVGARCEVIPVVSHDPATIVGALVSEF